jgi:endoglucanase
MERRTFVKNSGWLLAGLQWNAIDTLAHEPLAKRGLPQWRGFNLTDFNTPNPENKRRVTTEEQLKWMQDWGFDFVRLPIAYPYYLKFDRSKSITREEVYNIDESFVERIDRLVELAHKYNLHVSLNPCKPQPASCAGLLYQCRLPGAI